MKLQLLCLGLTLLSAQGEGNEVLRGNIDPEKISGEWYTVQLASDKREKIEEDGSMRVFVESIQVLRNSSLSFKYHKEVNGECKQLHFIVDRVEDGVYTVAYDGFNVFLIAETDYSSYLIIHLRNFKANGSFQLLELYGREPDVSAEIKKKFQDFSQENGIGEENIIDMTNTDRCLQARGEK